MRMHQSSYQPQKYKYRQDFVLLRPNKQRFDLPQCNPKSLPKKKIIEVKKDIVVTKEIDKQLINLKESEPKKSDIVSMDNTIWQQDLVDRSVDFEVSEVRKIIQAGSDLSQCELMKIQEGNHLPIPIYMDATIAGMNRCRVLNMEISFKCCERRLTLQRDRSKKEFVEKESIPGCGTCINYAIQIVNLVIKNGEQMKFGHTNFLSSQFNIEKMALVTQCKNSWKRSKDALIWRSFSRSVSKFCEKCSNIQAVTLKLKVGEDFEQPIQVDS